MEIVTEPVLEVRKWAIQKIQNLHDADRHQNAKALAAEFAEWISLEEEEDLNYMCLELEDDFGDQEIDVR